MVPLWSGARVREEARVGVSACERVHVTRRSLPLAPAKQVGPATAYDHHVMRTTYASRPQRLLPWLIQTGEGAD